MDQNNSRLRDDYVNMYGAPVTVVECKESGELLIPLNEVTKLGFKIYRKKHYNPALIEESAFLKEFNLAMLSAAKSYMFYNRFRFDEGDILSSIERCKLILEGKVDSPPKPDFLKSRQVERADHSIRITRDVNVASSPALTTQNLSAHNGADRDWASSANCSRGNGNSPRPQRNSDHGSDKLSVSSNRSKTSQNQRPTKRNGYVNNNGTPQNGDANEIVNGHKLRSPRDSEKRASAPRSFELNKMEELEERVVHKVEVTYVKGRTLIYVRKQAKMDTFREICLKAEQESDTQPDIDPIVHKMAMAEYEGGWFRCKILSTNPLKVFFVDYGNIEEVSAVKSISEALAAYPHQAIRVSFLESDYDPVIEDEIKIKPFRRHEDGTYVINVINEPTCSLPAEAPRPTPQQQQQQPPLKAQQQTSQEPQQFFKIPEQFELLKDGQQVLIFKEDNGKLFLRSKDCLHKFRQIESDLQNIVHVPVKSARPGQLVVAPNADATSLMRASVTEVRGDMATIRYLDTKAVGQVAISKISHISGAVANEPLTYMESPKICEPSNITPNGREVLQEAINSHTKFFVVLDGGRFDLKRKDNVLLSKQLTNVEINTATPAPSTVEVSSDRVMLSDMRVIDLKLGVDGFLVYYFHDVNNVTIVPTDLCAEYISQVIKTEMADSVAYTPIVGEVCWGHFGDEFYRCHVLSDLGKGKFKGIFIDFGNEVTVMTTNLRKLSDDVKDIPILGFPSKLVGLPSVANLDNQLSNLLEEGEVFEVDVKRRIDVDKKYEIDIPKVYNSLTQ